MLVGGRSLKVRTAVGVLSTQMVVVLPPTIATVDETAAPALGVVWRSLTVSSVDEVLVGKMMGELEEELLEELLLLLEVLLKVLVDEMMEELEEEPEEPEEEVLEVLLLVEVLLLTAVLSVGFLSTVLTVLPPGLVLAAFVLTDLMLAELALQLFSVSFPVVFPVSFPVLFPVVLPVVFPVFLPGLGPFGSDPAFPFPGRFRWGTMKLARG